MVLCKFIVNLSSVASSKSLEGLAAPELGVMCLRRKSKKAVITLNESKVVLWRIKTRHKVKNKMGNIKIEELNWEKAYSIDAFPFTLIEVIRDFYFLEPNGYLVIRDTNSTPMEENIEELLKKLAVKDLKFELSGGVAEPEYEQQGSFKALSGDWKPVEIKQLLFFIHLTKENVEELTKELTIIKGKYEFLAFYANWISYFKNNQTVIDVVHANDGFTEQLHISKEISYSRIQNFAIKRGLQINKT